MSKRSISHKIPPARFAWRALWSASAVPTTACDHVSARPLRKTDIPGAGGARSRGPARRPARRSNTTPPPPAGIPRNHLWEQAAVSGLGLRLGAGGRAAPWPDLGDQLF